jgi:hypothetical protein
MGNGPRVREIGGSEVWGCLEGFGFMKLVGVGVW